MAAPVGVPAQPPLIADGPSIHHEREPTPIEVETEIRVLPAPPARPAFR